MTANPLHNLEQLEADLWEAADQLRANSKLTSTEYYMPVLGIIFLRHAFNRYEAATRQIEVEQASGKMPKRRIIPADYHRRRALYLPEEARWSFLVAPPKPHDNLGQAMVAAMEAIEAAFEPLHGVLPKEYTIFERTVLEDLLRIFNREALNTVSGDVFGRIYEYFLMNFAMQGAQDSGEFFTPPALVQTIVNVIAPEHGKVFDPACGSGGMFVQSSYFIERLGHDAAKRVVFYGQEKTATTIKLAKMNLAVHGLQGDIREANTFYQDEHNLFGECDFVMANPPFNVDMVDSEKVKDDPRLPFGLPGVNKQKKVSNGNYLWISYFHSYLNDKGRAGFVMSSQASSAGHQEKEVRCKLVETGDMDVMIAIRSNFFYTRTVPCELWFFDRGKPKALRHKVLMLDARNIYRKVTRKIYDFSPEQLANLTAIVWLYRGQRQEFLGLIQKYFGSLCAESEAVPEKLHAFGETLHTLEENFSQLSGVLDKLGKVAFESRSAFAEARHELGDTLKPYVGDRDQVLTALEQFRKRVGKALPSTNDKQHASREAFAPIAEQLKGLIKQIDLLYKLAARVADSASSFNGEETVAKVYDRRNASKLFKQLEEQRKAAVEQLKHVAYFHKQIAWLQERFPEAELREVPGLVKLVDRKEIEAADWSLTPGRYVGVAPEVEDDDFDFEQTLRDIHIELADLNKEAEALAGKIQKNFEELGI